MIGQITITAVQTVNGEDEITTLFAPTDSLVLRIIFDLSNDLASLPQIRANITFMLIAAESNQLIPGTEIRWGVSIPTGQSHVIWWTPAKTVNEWGLPGAGGDVFGVRFIVGLDSEQQALDAFAVSDFQWFRVMLPYSYTWRPSHAKREPGISFGM